MSETIRPSRRRFQFEWLLLALALIGSGSFVTISLYEHYWHDEADERARLQAQAKVIDDNVVHHVASADRALATIVGDISYWRGGGPGSPRLKAFGEIIGGVRTLLIVDDLGRVMAASRDELLGTDVSQMEYFQSPRRKPARDLLYVSKPFQSTAGDRVITISRAVIGAGGGFDGIVVAELDPEFFTVLLQSVLYAPDMTSSIVHGDGRLYLAMPAGSTPARDDHGSATSLFARHRDSGAVISLLTGGDGAESGERLAALVTLRPPGVAADKSLVVAVSRDKAEIHAAWRREAREQIGLFGVFLLASIFGLRFHQRRQRRLDLLEAEYAASRRHSEAELRKLSRAVEQSAAAIVITDATGRIEYVNPAACAIYGYSEGELLDRNPRILRSGLTAPDVYQSMWETILAGHTWSGELTNRRRDGTLIVERMAVSPVRDDDGKVSHFVAIKSDIGAEREAERLRRELELRLIKVERMELLSAMAGGIAHDFNNILVAILGFSGIGRSAARAAGGSPRIAGYFEEIEMAGERARALVQQLRAFSRGGQMAVEPVDVAALAQEVIKLIKPIFPASIALAAEIEGKLPVLVGDPSHLHQLLMNLCVNARDAVSASGTVVVSARLALVDQPLICASCHREFSGEFFRIAVRDDGSGIPETIRERIFEPFFTTKEFGKGTGMGLAVVHGMAHLYEGHIQVLSKVGGGTELAVYLPRVIPRMGEPGEVNSGELMPASDG